jgi:hypothetical protein
MSVVPMLLLAGGLAAALVLAAPASAEPAQPGCAPLSPVCNMLPTLPELDHDLDLTTGQPELINRENQPPVDPCAAGCT